jgi:hypothetical protein
MRLAPSFGQVLILRTPTVCYPELTPHDHDAFKAFLGLSRYSRNTPPQDNLIRQKTSQAYYEALLEAAISLLRNSDAHDTLRTQASAFLTNFQNKRYTHGMRLEDLVLKQRALNAATTKLLMENYPLFNTGKPL